MLSLPAADDLASRTMDLKSPSCRRCFTQTSNSIAQSNGSSSGVQATTYEAATAGSPASAAPTGSNPSYPAANTYPSAAGSEPAGAANGGSIYTAGGSGVSVGGSASGGTMVR